MFIFTIGDVVGAVAIALILLVWLGASMYECVKRKIKPKGK